MISTAIGGGIILARAPGDPLAPSRRLLMQHAFVRPLFTPA